MTLFVSKVGSLWEKWWKLWEAGMSDSNPSHWQNISLTICYLACSYLVLCMLASYVQYMPDFTIPNNSFRQVWRRRSWAGRWGGVRFIWGLLGCEPFVRHGSCFDFMFFPGYNYLALHGYSLSSLKVSHIVETETHRDNEPRILEADMRERVGNYQAFSRNLAATPWSPRNLVSPSRRISVSTRNTNQVIFVIIMRRHVGERTSRDQLPVPSGVYITPSLIMMDDYPGGYYRYLSNPYRETTTSLQAS